MEFSLADCGSIFHIVKAFNSDAVLSIALSFTISFYGLAPNFTSHFDRGTFEVFLVVRLLGVFPVITSITIDFTHNLNNQWVMIWVRVRIWSVWRRLRRWWRWRFIVVRHMRRIR